MLVSLDNFFPLKLLRSMRNLYNFKIFVEIQIILNRITY